MGGGAEGWVPERCLRAALEWKFPNLHQLIILGGDEQQRVVWIGGFPKGDGIDSASPGGFVVWSGHSVSFSQG
jgi:hypothetical protein